MFDQILATVRAELPDGPPEQQKLFALMLADDGILPQDVPAIAKRMSQVPHDRRGYPGCRELLDSYDTTLAAAYRNHSQIK